MLLLEINKKLKKKTEYDKQFRTLFIFSMKVAYYDGIGIIVSKLVYPMGTSIHIAEIAVW